MGGWMFLPLLYPIAVNVWYNGGTILREQIPNVSTPLIGNDLT